MVRRRKAEGEVVEPLADEDGELGEDGLTLTQRQFLMILATGKSPQQACNELELSIRTYFRWQKLPQFQEAIDKLFSPDDLQKLKQALHISAADAVEVLEDTMHNAIRKLEIKVKCPHCNEEFETVITVEDYKSRLTAAGMVLKVSGILLDRKETKVDVNVNYRLTMQENLMLLRYNRGEYVPPVMLQRLRELNKITGDQPLALPAGVGYAEGEFRDSQEDSLDEDYPGQQ